jgi:hypothetical protein
MSTITARKPSKVRAKRFVRVPDRDDWETRIAIPGVDWKVYDVLSDAVGEGSYIRITYDGRDLEIIATSGLHDYFKDLTGVFIHEVSTAMRIPISGSGQTTWKRPELARGLEADQSYYFLPDKILVVGAAIKRRSMDIADFPNPDMAVEIDISPPLADRRSIYKALQVAEIWYFDGNELAIEQLQEDGTYAVAEMSRFLPIRPAEIRRWLVEEDSSNQTAWCLRLRAWLRRISQRRNPPTKRPNRRKNRG